MSLDIRAISGRIWARIQNTKRSDNKMRDEFCKYHPIVNIIYYCAVIGITMFLMNPVFIGISVIASACYLVYLKGKKAASYLAGMMIVFILAMLINPLFSHRGVTLLFYLPTGNPVTTESIIYGMASAAVLVAVIIWFYTFNEVITSDKIMAVFGNILPAISLIFSMVLRFVPKFAKHAKETGNANKLLQGRERENIVGKIRNQMKVFSITLTWALENSIDTADSMRARGYGVGKRSNYNNYRLSSRDLIILAVMIATVAIIVAGMLDGDIFYSYYPSFELSINKKLMISAAAYFALCFMPVAINIVEEIKWHRLKSKI